LGTRGYRAIELARIYRNQSNDALFWEKFIENLMSKEDMENYNAHKSGTMKLQPFYENITDDMAHGFLKKLTGEVPKDYKGIGSFSTAQTILTKQMFDNDSATFYTSGMAQKAGDWIGVDLRTVRDVTKISILQGRNSVDDVDYFDHAVLEYSANGRDWNALIDDMQKQYVINWEGESVKARYIRIRRLDSKRSNFAAVRSFDVNPISIDNIGFAIATNEPKETMYAFDSNLGTSYKSENIDITMDVTEGTVGYTLLMNKVQAPVKCTQWDKKGKLVAETLLDKPFSKIEIADAKKVVKVKIEGAAEIYEIITDKAK
jgi:hyaluronoglucosaminidase